MHNSEVKDVSNGTLPNTVGDNTSVTELSRVAFRAPPFWKANAELWFYQLESQFITAGIVSEETKFHSVVAAVDTEILTYVSDLVRNPPAKDKYTKLKERIVKQFSQSETARIRSLLQDLQLGDRKPSQLLREMRDLASGQLTDEKMLAQLWKQRLPIACQQILSVSTCALEELSAIADKITEVPGMSAVVSEVRNNPSCSCNDMQKQVSELRESVERLSRNVVRKNSFGNRRDRSHSRERRQRSPAAVERHQMCWYHYRFANKARNCNPPCSFKKTTDQQGN